MGIITIAAKNALRFIAPKIAGVNQNGANMDPFRRSGVLDATMIVQNISLLECGFVQMNVLAEVGIFGTLKIGEDFYGRRAKFYQPKSFLYLFLLQIGKTTIYS